MTKKEKLEAKKRREKITKWLNSPEGKRAIEEARAQNAQCIAKLQESRRITPEILWRPYGPADGGRVWPHQKR